MGIFAEDVGDGDSGAVSKVQRFGRLKVSRGRFLPRFPFLRACLSWVTRVSLQGYARKLASFRGSLERVSAADLGARRGCLLGEGQEKGLKSSLEGCIFAAVFIWFMRL